MALLNFEDSYKIELCTDDTMTQDATARTVKILDSSSKCIVGKKFDTLINSANGKRIHKINLNIISYLHGSLCNAGKTIFIPYTYLR